MERMLVNATQADAIRVAIIKDNQLIDLDTEQSGTAKTKANIYKGRVTRTEPSLGAAFIDYGAEKQGFLPLKEIAPHYFNDQKKPGEKVSISDILSPGQELLVQVEKVERGSKGAALTTYISIAGSYLVLMPNNPKAGGISKRIEGEERDELKNILDNLDIPKGAGLIVRTAGYGKEAELLQWDLEIITHQWQAIQDVFHNKKAPFLIHEDGDVVIRSIRDHLQQNITDIVIDNQSVYRKAKQYIEQIRPDFINKLKLYQDEVPLFTRYNIEEQIEAAHHREITLPSGGSIVIDKTEALYAIDINSAKATKGGDIEETALNTNLEAATEIARQLKIRDMGGLIVIDFIDMNLSKNQRAVETHFKEATASDKAKIQIGKLSRFGLLEISRQLLRPSLTEYANVVCPRCDGTGSIRNTETLARVMLRILEQQAINNKNKTIVIQIPINIATFILNEKKHTIVELETRFNVRMIIVPNKYLHAPNYNVEILLTNSHHKQLSYEMLQKPMTEDQENKIDFIHKNEKPAINGFQLPNNHTKPGRAWFSWLKKIFNKKAPKTKHNKHNPRNKGHKHRKPHYRKSQK